jgi:V/A-type H+-transporting ATPase subunit D
MADVKPTRSELIKLKQKIKLAKSGHGLLKKKRDGLIMEFFDLMKEAKGIKKEMTEKYNEALSKMNVARILNSDMEIKTIALSIYNSPDIDVEKRNLVGVVVPKITKRNELVKKIIERGFSIYNSAAIDEVASAYEILVEKIIKVAEIETSMRKVLEEIEKTKRRVNALEFEVIPKMEKQATYIRMRLEEMERESFTRLKRIKAK